MTKKIVYIIIAFPILLLQSSCHRSQIEEREPIQLGCAVQSVTTKSVISGKESLVTESYNGSTGFGVYGYKTVNTQATQVFNNTEVMPERDNVETDWYYSPIRYWDSNPEASYQFAAYWPYMGTSADSGPYVSESNKVLSIHAIPNWQPSADGKDILTADRRGKYRPIGEPFSSGKVSFQFSHLLSLVQFRAYYVGTQDREVKITGLRLSASDASHPVMSASGTVEYTYPFGGQENSNPVLTAPTAAAQTDEIVLLGTPGVTLSQDSWYDESQGATPPSTHPYEAVCSWFTAPCTYWNSLKLDIDYTVDGAAMTGSAELTLTSTDGSTVYTGQTLSGHAYMVTLKLTAANGIELESIVMNEWNTVESTTSLYNW